MYEKLHELIGGDVIEADDARFDEDRRVWNGMIDRRPALVVHPRTTDEVAASVRYAVEQGLRVAARGGGHNVAGRAVPDGAMVIDLGHLNAVEVDESRQIARVGAGARLADLDRETQKYGLATPAGVDSRTGVAGLTLGGGIGWLSRRFGLASDNLVGAEVVTADGSVVRASERENEDLFWALRGGGPGAPGIVTAFEFQSHAVGPEVMVAQAYHDIDALPILLAHHRDLMSDAPDEFNCYLLIIHAPPVEPFPEDRWGAPVVALVSCDTGDGDVVETRARSVVGVGDPFVADAGPMPYTALQSAFDAGAPNGARYYFKAEMLDDVTDAALEAIATGVGSLPGELSMLVIEPLGGAVAGLADDATAWPHRRAAANFGIFAGWTDADDDDDVILWARTLHGAVAEHGSGRSYVNYLDRDEDVEARGFGTHAGRLREIRSTWDPNRVFVAPGEVVASD